MNMAWGSRRATTSAAAAVLLASFAFALQPGRSAGDLACPPGYQLAGSEEARISKVGNLNGLFDVESQKLARLLPEGSDVALDQDVCVLDKHPEGLEELEGLAAQRAAVRSAPNGVIPAGAITRATAAKNALLKKGQDKENSHVWQPVGRGPLQSADPGYEGVNGLGIVEAAGRITTFQYVPSTDKYYPDTLFAAKAYGGVWMTDSNVTHWVSIGDSLPTQVVGAVGYTPYGGGTIIALTGDGSFGRYSREGAGAFYSTNGGRTWKQSLGIPDEAFGFKISVDKANPRNVYAATGSGLYTSSDGGRYFRNAKLPTGTCAGKSNRVKACLLANMVTDVVVMAPGGTTEEKGGQVLAAVGWRGGNRANPDGSIQSPNNGLYLSPTGLRGTFTKLAATGFVSQDRIGRVELGEAYGPNQNHNYVYAIVQDAILQRDGLPGIDAPGFDFNTFCKDAKEQAFNALSNVPRAPKGLPFGLPPCEMPTVLNGIYVSADFGNSWRLMADASELLLPGTGSALVPGFAAIGSYAPGVQGWYNLFIKPDPTLADPVLGAPTRLVFGLEEVWENTNVNVPQIGPSTFRVIGRYFSGTQCLAILLQNLPACPTNGTEALLTETTTHPDQHDAVFIPKSDGVQLVVGNDGGVYKQFAKTGTDYSNAYWGNGANTGFNTLLPYDAIRSADGTVWMGLQDNGTAKIVDVVRNGRVVERGRQIMTKGGDGFFVAVHPTNGKTAYGEYVGGAVASTIDGGLTWSEMTPPITDAQFSTPFVMDPLDPDHLMIAGRQIVETGSGPGTSSLDWATDFDLGTHLHPASKDAVATPEDPANAMSALDLVGPNAYVGFCGPCTVLDSKASWKSGLATNVGGSRPAKRYSTQGWHMARAKGLPNRYITGIAIDRTNPRTVYVSLGGYLTRWTPPGYLDKNARAGGEHVYVSHDAGNTFTDVSGNLPDTPVNFITMRGKQLIIATDIGVFVSKAGRACDRSCTWQVLGRGLPAANIHTVRLSHGDPNLITVAAYGRGVWAYRFGPKPAVRGTAGGRALPAPKFLDKLIASFDFEADEQGWTAKTTNELEVWERRAPGSLSAFSFQVMPYTDETAAALLSPKMTLPARGMVKVEWDELRDTEDGFDYMTIDWSSDGYKWYSARSISGQNPDWPTFTTVSTQFVAPKGDLYLRFRLTSDQLISSPPYTGAALDNIIVKY